MESHHIAARIGIDRTSIAAIDLPEVIIEVRDDHVINIFIRRNNILIGHNRLPLRKN